MLSKVGRYEFTEDSTEVEVLAGMFPNRHNLRLYHCTSLTVTFFLPFFLTPHLLPRLPGPRYPSTCLKTNTLPAASLVVDPAVDLGVADEAEPGSLAVLVHPDGAAIARTSLSTRDEVVKVGREILALADVCGAGELQAKEVSVSPEVDEGHRTAFYRGRSSHSGRGESEEANEGELHIED